jgi:hypothetical protein
MKNLLIVFVLSFVSFVSFGQTLGGTETFRVVDGDTLWSPTITQLKTWMNVPTFGAANTIVGTNDAGTALENITFSVGTTGSDFNLVETGAAVVFHLPDAGASARGAVTTAAQTFAGLKSFGAGSSHTATTTVEGINAIGVVQYKYDLLSAATTLSGLHNSIGLDASTAYTVTLPAVTTAGEWVYTFTILTGASIITIDPNGAQTFSDGATQKLLSGEGTTFRIQSNGATWMVID